MISSHDGFADLQRYSDSDHSPGIRTIQHSPSSRTFIIVMASSPALIVCGPQTDIPSPEYLAQVRLVLLHDSRLTTFLGAIKDLARTWEKLLDLDTRLNAVPGLNGIAAIHDWIEQSDLVQIAEEPLNVLCTPLTVIFQIVEYIHFLTDSNTTHQAILKGTAQGGIQGFCVGFLVATALSSSNNEEEIGHYGAIALRLALCVGAYVDLAGRYANPAIDVVCLPVRWKEPTHKDEIHKILQDHPDVSTSDCITV